MSANHYPIRHDIDESCRAKMYIPYGIFESCRHVFFSYAFTNPLRFEIPASFTILLKKGKQAMSSKIKLNCGSAWTMFRHGWHNLDMMDLHQFAGMHGYNYHQCDLRSTLPYNTGTVDLIFVHHTLQQLTHKDGLAFLRECRRVIKPDGRCGMRIVVPDAGYLQGLYTNAVGETLFDPKIMKLSEFDEMSEECKAAKTPAMKLQALLYSGGTAAIYDMETLCYMLTEAGFEPHPSEFRYPEQEGPFKQIAQECLEMSFCNSLFCNAIPALG